MTSKNSVFIATSIDGYIADENGGIDWLHSTNNPENNDAGYSNFMSNIDALVMGRNTYETIVGFDMDWPYTKPVFVLSSTLRRIPEGLQNKVFLTKGSVQDILKEVQEKGYENLYIDGGITINSFLKEDLIDELIITTIPILLGGGTPLFSQFPKSLAFELVDTKTYLNQLVQRKYQRKRTVL